jgi:hypothetical protein
MIMLLVVIMGLSCLTSSQSGGGGDPWSDHSASRRGESEENDRELHRNMEKMDESGLVE